MNTRSNNRPKLIALAKLEGFHHGHHMQTKSLETIMGAKTVRLNGYYVQYNVLNGEIQAWTESSRIKTYSENDAARILVDAEVKAQTMGVKYSEAVAELVINDLQDTAS